MFRVKRRRLEAELLRRPLTAEEEERQIDRAAQALENLRQSIGYRPDLKQWAKDDTDLASVREMPEVIALITDETLSSRFMDREK